MSLQALSSFSLLRNPNTSFYLSYNPFPYARCNGAPCSCILQGYYIYVRIWLEVKVRTSARPLPLALVGLCCVRGGSPGLTLVPPCVMRGPVVMLRLRGEFSWVWPAPLPGPDSLQCAELHTHGHIVTTMPHIRAIQWSAVWTWMAEWRERLEWNIEKWEWRITEVNKRIHFLYRS